MPKKPEMSYEELMSIHRLESRQNSLTKLDSAFYQRTNGYLDALQNRCLEESRSASENSGLLINQLKTVKGKTSEIYEIRTRKIALMAMISAYGGDASIENMTPEEIDLFKVLEGVFSGHKRTTISPESPAVKETEVQKTLEGERSAVKEGHASKPADDTVLVRILEDLPTLAGAEKNYSLQKEDVISLPKKMAEILLRSNKAVEIRRQSV